MRFRFRSKRFPCCEVVVVVLRRKKPPRRGCSFPPPKHGTTDLERLSLAFCSIVSNVVVLTGITLGDIDTSSPTSMTSSFRQSRHSRTVTVLFRAKINSYQSQQQQSSENDTTNNNKGKEEVIVVTNPPVRQTLILVIDHDTTDENQLKSMVQNEIISLYQAAAVEKVNAPTFETLYDLQIIMTTQVDKVRNYKRKKGIFFN